MKTFTAAQPVSGDAIRSLCDHVFWCNARPVEDAGFRPGDVVFCKIDEAWRLFRALRRTRKRIILITGEGDKPVDFALWRRKPPHVAFWFGTNMQVTDEASVCGLPLGLGSAGSRKTPRWEEICAVSQQAPVREKCVYANFSADSNPTLRGPLLEWLAQSAQSWITRAGYDPGAGRFTYLQELCSHRFVLCPPGNGEDTHRFWEALYCGAIPIIRRSDAMSWFSSLPAVKFDDFRDLTPTLLDEAYSRVDPEDYPTLWVDYWRQRIAAARAHIGGVPLISWRDWFGAWVAEVAAITK